MQRMMRVLGPSCSGSASEEMVALRYVRFSHSLCPKARTLTHFRIFSNALMLTS